MADNYGGKYRDIAALLAAKRVPVGGVPGYAMFEPMEERGAELRARQPSMGEEIGGMARDALAPYDQTIADRVSGAMTTGVDYGVLPAQAYVGQIKTAGDSLEKAAGNPSLANITNAGVQTGLAIGSPTVAGVSALGGLGVAAASDMGLGIPDANAQRRKVPPAPADLGPEVADLPGLSPAQNAEYKAQTMRMRSHGQGNWLNANERKQIEATLGSLRGISEEFAKTENSSARLKREAEEAASREEYQNQVAVAEAARAKELGRVRRFSDTSTGKVLNELGGTAPVAAGGVVGMVSRLAGGPGSAIKQYAIPVGAGMLAGFTAANVPLAADAFYTDADNPEKAAWQAYARELPDGHPRKISSDQYAGKLPDANPVRSAASREFYDDFGKRAAMSMLEGGGGGLVGTEVIQAGRRLARVGRPGGVLGEVPGEVATATPGQTKIAEALAKVQPAKSAQAAQAAQAQAMQRQIEAEQLRRDLQAQRPTGTQTGATGPMRAADDATAVQPRDADQLDLFGSQGPGRQPTTAAVPNSPNQTILPPSSNTPTVPQQMGDVNSSMSGVREVVKEYLDGKRESDRILAELLVASRQPTRRLPPPGGSGGQGAAAQYNAADPVTGKAPADYARQIYLDAVERSGGNRPTTGTGGTLKKKEFADLIRAQTKTETSFPTGEIMRKRRGELKKGTNVPINGFERDAEALAKAEGITYREAVERLFKARPLVDKDGVRQTLASDTLAIPFMAGGAAAGAMAYPTDASASDQQLARLLLGY